MRPITPPPISTMWVPIKLHWIILNHVKSQFPQVLSNFSPFFWPWGERPCHGPLRSFSSPVPRSPSAPLGPRCQSPGRWGSAPEAQRWRNLGICFCQISSDCWPSCWCFKSYWLLLCLKLLTWFNMFDNNITWLFKGIIMSSVFNSSAVKVDKDGTTLCADLFLENTSNI